MLNLYSMAEKVSIQLERTGGFAGMSPAVSIDSELLPPDKNKELLDMIDKSGIWEYSNSKKTEAVIPDQFEYILTIKTKVRTNKIILQESSIPDELKPLFIYLKSQLRRN